MSIKLRPVIEKWGAPLDCSDSDYPITVIDTILEYITNGTTDEDVSRCYYGDMDVVCISNGKSFLDGLTDINEDAFEFWLVTYNTAPPGLIETLMAMKAMVPQWRKSIDLEDGSLRFYIG